MRGDCGEKEKVTAFGGEWFLQIIHSTDWTSADISSNIFVIRQITLFAFVTDNWQFYFQDGADLTGTVRIELEYGHNTYRKLNQAAGSQPRTPTASIFEAEKKLLVNK